LQHSVAAPQHCEVERVFRSGPLTFRLIFAWQWATPRIELSLNAARRVAFCLCDIDAPGRAPCRPVEKSMSILKFARSAAAIAAATMLPAHAVASAPAGMSVAASSIAAAGQEEEAGGDEGHPFFNSEFLIPTVIVIVLALGLYFVLEDGEDEEDGGPGPTPVTP